MKHNFVIEKDGKEYWISRSIAILAIVLCEIKGQTYVLVNRRGIGTPDYQGYWNLPCGYLDYNETCKEAIEREVWEECGVHLDTDKIKFYGYNDDLTDPRQNVTLRFITTLDVRFNKISIASGINNRGGEPDEVEAISWIPLNNYQSVKWAFNHEVILKKLNHEISNKQ